MDDKKAIKITRLIREIKEKQKLITHELLGVYIDKNFKPKDVASKLTLIDTTYKEITNKHFEARDMFHKEDAEEILIKYKNYLDKILSYQEFNKQRRIFNLIAGGVVLIVFVWLLSPSSKKTTSHTSSQSSSYNQYGDIHGAWAYMQIFVEQRLKSPKSADFPFGGGTYHTKDLGGGRYEVNSYVDAKNAFGANIRTHFNGVIRRKDSGWVLEYLNLGDTSK